MNDQRPGPRPQNRGLYRSLLGSPSQFDEFKRFLVRYPSTSPVGEEPQPAADVRAQLNARIADWLGGEFDGLSPRQVLLWRDIVIADEDADENEEAHDRWSSRSLESSLG